MAVGALYAAYQPGMRQLMPEAFLRRRLLLEIVPLMCGLALFGVRPRHAAGIRAAALLVIFAAARAIEAGGIYPSCPGDSLSPSLPFLDVIPRGAPVRMLALGEMFVPNLATIYELEDVRGYESMKLNAFVATYPLWSKQQGAWYNRVDDLPPPFLSFLNVGYAIVPSGYPPPPGWRRRASDRNADLLRNRRYLPRAFTPAFVRFAATEESGSPCSGPSPISGSKASSIPDPGRAPALAPQRQGSGRDHGLPGAVHGARRQSPGGDDRRHLGPRLAGLEGGARRRRGGAALLQSRLPGARVRKGTHRLELRYRPDGYVLGAAASLLTLVVAVLALLVRRRPAAVGAVSA